MGAIRSYADNEGLLDAISRSYSVGVDQIELHRDMIGHVYFCGGSRGRYVLKLYRPHQTGNALNSIGILQYLKESDYPVVSIVPADRGELHIPIDTPDGRCVAILYDYVPGTEPDVETEIADIGLQMGRLHELMKSYPGRLPRRGRGFYIDRYISLLKEKGYPWTRARQLEELGGRLWERIDRLPPGFCHGDLHRGNMRRTESGAYVLFDWDAASQTRSIIDVATLCDESDFNVFDESAYERTMRRFTEFQRGYTKTATITGAEIDAIPDFIAVRHYELIATIAGCQGLEGISNGFLDEQYEWLLRWEEMCAASQH